MGTFPDSYILRVLFAKPELARVARCRRRRAPFGIQAPAKRDPEWGVKLARCLDANFI
jgi:hypothetical protein